MKRQKKRQVTVFGIVVAWFEVCWSEIVFHMLLTQFALRTSFLAQVVSQGNIIIGDEVEMTSKQKTFAVALSREMVPTARIIVYYLRQPEEVVTDVLNFFVNGTRQNQVCRKTHILLQHGKRWWRHVSFCHF